MSHSPVAKMCEVFLLVKKNKCVAVKATCEFLEKEDLMAGKNLRERPHKRDNCTVNTAGWALKREKGLEKGG